MFELLPAIDLARRSRRPPPPGGLRPGDGLRRRSARRRARVRRRRGRPGSTSSTWMVRGRGSRASWSWWRRSSPKSVGAAPRRGRRGTADGRGRRRGARRPGAARVAVGTAILRDPAFAAALVARHGPDRIVASIDVRDGLALGEGWRAGRTGASRPRWRWPGSPCRASPSSRSRPIERDGLLEGPDLDLLRSLVALGRGRIIASGGVVIDRRPAPDPGRRMRRRDRGPRALRGPDRPRPRPSGRVGGRPAARRG